MKSLICCLAAILFMALPVHAQTQVGYDNDATQAYDNAYWAYQGALYAQQLGGSQLTVDLTYYAWEYAQAGYDGYENDDTDGGNFYVAAEWAALAQLAAWNDYLDGGYTDYTFGILFNSFGTEEYGFAYAQDGGP